jgi:diguanylate cyclase (GGDEF)-like protein
LLDSEYEDRVSELTVRLQSVHHESEIIEILARHAPPLGIQPTCLALYEPQGDDRVGSCRILLPSKQGPSDDAEAAELRLDTRTFAFDRFLSGSTPRCLAVLPLIHKGRSPGFVAFATEILAPLAAVARQLAVALENVRLQAAVRDLTLKDDLTGLHNRRFFESELRREIERCRRFRHDLALVMLDLDHFKDYNDTFGHRAGDDALRHVASCLGDSTHRLLDAIVRYGGEEFAVLLTETDAEGARQVAERFRQAIEASTGFLRPLTVSAGVAALHGSVCDAERLVLETDRALYRAKREGRNRVCVATWSDRQDAVGT